MKRTAALLAFLLCAPGSPAAFADDPGARQAQSLFADGTAALQRGELAEARRLLEASLATHEHPATAFNLAVTLRGLGAPLEALTPLEALAAGRYGPLPPDRRNEVLQLLTDTRAMLGTLQIELAGPARAELRIDGHATGALVRGTATTVPVNPGARLVEVDAAGFRPLVKRIDVPRGSVTRAELAMLPVVVPSDPALASSADGPTPERASRWRSPWLWVGLATVAVGATVALAWWRPFERGPERDPVFGTVTALGVRD